MALPQASADSLNAWGDPVWRDPQAARLPALDADIDADACVVGLGGSGLAAIEAFVDAGLDVVGIDRDDIAAGAAGANGGFLLAGLAQFHHDAVRRFGRERALGIYRLTCAELERVYAAYPSSTRRTGSLRIAADAAEESDCAAQIDAMLADGLAVSAYDGPDGRGLVVPGDGAFQPALHWRAVARSLAVRGARLFGDAAMTSVEAGLVHTRQARVRAPIVVIAIDGGLEAALPSLAGRVRSVRLQMLATDAAPECSISQPVYFRHGHDYWQQLPDGRIALGGGRDVGGDAEWQAGPGVSTPVQRHLETLLRERLGTRAPIAHRWSAAVAFTADGLPAFGEHLPDVFVTGAYNGTGNIFGGLCGRALAHLALGERTQLADYLLEGRATDFRS